MIRHQRTHKSFGSDPKARAGSAGRPGRRWAGRGIAGRSVACLAGAGILLLAGTALGAGGDLLWEDVFDGAGSQDIARAVAVKGRSVYGAGESFNAVSPTSSADWLVRANDAKTGASLWQRSIDVAGGTDSAYSIAVSGRTVIVVCQKSAHRKHAQLQWLRRVPDLCFWPISPRFGGLDSGR